MSDYQYSVDKGVPLPNPRVRGGKLIKYPWDELQVGDSFFVPTGSVKNIQVMRSNCHQRSQRSKHRYIVREVTGGYRIWRTE